ncbi:hypothetical protein WS45_04155 [Burkholderia sp. RF2-non_BP3]|nr:hypothetical protein WS45_04155 [Burkholderia sp. RF2-non_BP3]
MAPPHAGMAPIERGIDPANAFIPSYSPAMRSGGAMATNVETVPPPGKRAFHPQRRTLAFRYARPERTVRAPRGYGAPTPCQWTSRRAFRQS